MQSYSQNKKTEKKDSVNLWQGLWVETDVAPLAGWALINKEIYSLQGNIQINLKNKYFPVMEMGFAGASKTTSNHVRFATNGMFGKIGIDIPLLKPKPNATQKNNFFLVGVRFGMSPFSYSIYNQTIKDEYWKNSETFNLEAIPSTKFWFEITGGLRVDVYKSIYMGWTVRNKHLINRTKLGENASWYIPGYGKGNTSVWGFSYCIGYKIK